jgi:hypothetical protein
MRIGHTAWWIKCGSRRGAYASRQTDGRRLGRSVVVPRGGAFVASARLDAGEIGLRQVAPNDRIRLAGGIASPRPPSSDTVGLLADPTLMPARNGSPSTRRRTAPGSMASRRCNPRAIRVGIPGRRRGINPRFDLRTGGRLATVRLSARVVVSPGMLLVFAACASPATQSTPVPAATPVITAAPRTALRVESTFRSAVLGADVGYVVYLPEGLPTRSREDQRTRSAGVGE